MTMMEKAISRLRNTAGESIAETLIALLISSLALIMLAGAVSTATDIVKRSKTTMSAYYDADSALTNVAEGSGSITVTLAETNAPEETAVSQEITVSYASNAVFGNKVVVAYAATSAPTTP